MRGTPGCAQYQSFARDCKSSLPNNGFCVDCCCLACCTSLTRSQNGSAAKRWKETPRQKLNMRRRHRRTCGMRAEYRMYCRLEQQHIYPHPNLYLNSDTGSRTFSRQWVTDYLESFPAFSRGARLIGRVQGHGSYCRDRGLSLFSHIVN